MADLDPEFIAKLRTIVENHSVALYNMNNIYTSRAYKVGVNARGLMREPVKYGKKIPNLALRHPTKLVKYVTGSKRIVSSEEKDNFDKSYLEWIKKNAHTED